MLSKQLQDQIIEEGKKRMEGWHDKMKAQVAKEEYEVGAVKYAALYETALARAEDTTEKIIDLMDFVAVAKGHVSDEEIISQVKKSLPLLLEALTPNPTSNDPQTTP